MMKGIAMSDAGQVLGEYLAAKPPPTQAAIRSSREPYSVHLWKKAIPSMPELGPLVARFPIGISRDDLFAIANQRERFIASLMWGYGNQVGRYGILNRTLPSVLADPKLNARLNNCATHLAAGLIGPAYSELWGIVGIGPPFFTKFMYATGVTIGMDQYPTIYDTKVSTSLAALTGYLMHVDLGTGFRPWAADPKPYVWHVNWMHACAAALKIETDVLEYTLYRDPVGIAVQAELYFTSQGVFP
jgi:hypothetical protein